MPTSTRPLAIGDPTVQTVVETFLQPNAARTRTVTVDGQARTIPVPFPSPADWRDCWIYFLMVDRFNNPQSPPVSGRWDKKFDFRQGGTLNGIRAQLGYIRDLGAGAIWLTPVQKNPKSQDPGEWRYNYHGYGIQDFLSVDERFGSDGTRETAERELEQLVNEAHARGLYVILDIVLNHAGRVFDYIRDGQTVGIFRDPNLLHGPLGSEAAIRWMNGQGQPQTGWDAPPGFPSGLPAPSTLSADDAVWPADLHRADFFRRRGGKVSDDPPVSGFVPGDFENLRQLVAEYVAGAHGSPLRAAYGPAPVLNILIRAYEYLIARFDIDAFRIDTAKYITPRGAEIFGNAIREFAMAGGKNNFFTFGEIVGGNQLIARYVGRNSSDVDSFGIDAALDFPLFDALRPIAKSLPGGEVQRIRHVFEDRKAAERELLSTHGEAGRFFVTFLDNHDQHERFLHPNTPVEQLTLALTLLFGLHGIPCLYYGTEQGLRGTTHDNGTPALGSNESVREALWGKSSAFNRQSALFDQIRRLASIRAAEPAMRYGRLYFRELSGNGRDFGHSSGVGGVVAFSRILVDREVLVTANTSTSQQFAGVVLVDPDLNPPQRQFRVAFSNRGTQGTGSVQHIPQARFFTDGQTSSAHAAALPLVLQPMESQILVPV